MPGRAVMPVPVCRCCSVPRLPLRNRVFLLLVRDISSSPLSKSSTSSSSSRVLWLAASSASLSSSPSFFVNLCCGCRRRPSVHPFLRMEKLCRRTQERGDRSERLMNTSRKQENMVNRETDNPILFVVFTCEEYIERRMEDTCYSAALLLPLFRHRSKFVAAAISVLLLCPYPIYAASVSSAVMPLLNTDNRSWTRGSIDKNKGLVEHLQQYGVIKSKKVAEVMETIDRGLFVPNGTAAYVDSPMPIGYNATISAPHMHATCLELLKEHLQPGMHALDVGSGTGYLTACFAVMVGPQGHAVGVEHIPEIVASSIENIKKSAAADLWERGSLSVHLTDGRLGWPELAPYDAIHVGAAAPDLPQPLIQQLKPGGRMVIPVGKIFQELKVVDKKLDGSISVYTETAVRYVPLTSRTAQLQGD